jgi:acetyltransferase-like isoleucine patch superfamily enzyme
MRAPLLVYGAGMTGQKVAAVLAEQGYAIQGFLDISAEPGQNIGGLPVMTARNWVKQNNPANHAAIIAISNIKFFPELPSISNSLKQYGFHQVFDFREIHFPDPRLNSYQIHDINMFVKHYPNHSMGVWSYYYRDLLIFDSTQSGAKLIIGSYTSIASNVKIMLEQGRHHHDWVTTYPWMHVAEDIQSPPVTNGDVVIGSDVWIGFDALILSGITIGHGAIVGARAVVSRSVEPYSIVAGNPARHIRYRFPESVRGALLKIRWWDWPHDEIMKVRRLLFSDRIDDFLRYAETRSSGVIAEEKPEI